MFKDDLQKEQAIDLLAKGDMNYESIATTVGVTAMTLRRWRRDPEFAAEVRKRALERLKEHLPAIYSVVAKKGLDGDLRAIEIMLGRVDRADQDLEEAKSRQSNISFTWKRGR